MLGIILSLLVLQLFLQLEERVLWDAVCSEHVKVLAKSRSCVIPQKQNDSLMLKAN